jgi:hypothetical protein
VNTSPRTTEALGIAAAGFGALAGLSQVVVGSASWNGDKNDPTTLGWVTVGLAVVLGSAATAVARAATAATRVSLACVLITVSLIGMTTSGLAWTPAAVAGAAAGVLTARTARTMGPIWPDIAAHWPDALLVVLGLVYLTFGVVSRDGRGLLGVVGALAVFAAVALHERAFGWSAGLVVLGAAPFAIAAWWTVIVPFTALLMLAVGLPHMAAVRRAPAAEGTR